MDLNPTPSPRPSSSSLVIQPSLLAIQEAPAPLPDPLGRIDPDPWTRRYHPPAAPGLWVARLAEWHKEPYPGTTAWYCFDDRNPHASQPYTALAATENDPLGETLLARCGIDVGWHYLIGVERHTSRDALVWSMAVPLQPVIEGPHANEWVRLMNVEPGRLRARSYTDDGHLNTLWDARVKTLTNAFDSAGTHHLYLRVEDDLGESVIQVPPPLVVDLMLHSALHKTITVGQR